MRIIGDLRRDSDLRWRCHLLGHGCDMLRRRDLSGFGDLPYSHMPRRSELPGEPDLCGEQHMLHIADLSGNSLLRWNDHVSRDLDMRQHAVMSRYQHVRRNSQL